MHVLVVEDNATLRHSLQKGLVEQGYQVTACAALGPAREALARGGVNLVLLDLQLPDGSGLDWLRELRAASPALPVLVLTARDSIQDRVRGLDDGADDYLVKPFAFAELVARVRALLRRREMAADVLRIGALELDVVQRRVCRGGEEICCTPREFELLVFLARKAGQPVSRGELAEHIWKIKRRMTSLDNVIDVQISRLRDKIDRRGEPPLISTIRGLGFVLQAKP